jgi:hypothetical protein
MANRSQLYEYKGNKCAHCGLDVVEMMERYGGFERIFELHHVTAETKAENYSNLIRQRLSSIQLDEVDKCILMCSTCHKIVESVGQNATARITVSIGRRRAEQEIKGQVVLDHSTHTGRFLSNERLLLRPYTAKLGRRKPVLVFGVELFNGRFIEYLRMIPQVKSLVIREYRTNEVLVRVKHVQENTIEVAQDISVPFMSFEGRETQGDDTFLWFRHGIGLTRDGRVLRHGMLSFTGTINVTA